jgi:hypothetical protein
VANKEFLVITESLKTWRHYLLGKEFEILTDHQSLSRIPHQTTLSPRQVRAVELLSQYHYTITYRPGKKNIPADALSRQTDHTLNSTVAITPDEKFITNFIKMYPDDPALALPYDLVQ